MRWLPPLIADGTLWYLPLPDHTARTFVEILVHRDRLWRREPIIRAISLDPALALWSICRASTNQGMQLRTFAATADWLLARGILVEMQWSPQGNASSYPDHDECRDRWAELAVAGIRAFRAAARKQRKLRNNWIDEEAVFLALVQNAQSWTPQSQDSPRSAESTRARYLPEWLDESLRRLGSDTSVADNSRADTDRTFDDDRSSQHFVSGNDDEVPLESMGDYWLRTDWPSQSIFALLLCRLVRLDRLEHDFSAQLEREKLLAMKELAYGAGHEINNPLANISSRAQTLLREERDPERRRKLATINSQAFRAHQMIADMMLFAKPPLPEPRAVELTALIDQVIAELSPRSDQQGTEVYRRVDGPLPPIEADPVQVAAALRAICDNALDALGIGGQVVISAAIDTTDGGPEATIEVRDTGPGLTDEIRQHLFDPFYSGREAGRGLGLGLSKAWRIVTEHGGTITVQSDPGQGASFAIRLPVKAMSVVKAP